jgi:hypothetical protein
MPFNSSSWPPAFLGLGVQHLAMSFGSLSANAIRVLNAGASKGGFSHGTGEGSISPYHLEAGGRAEHPDDLKPQHLVGRVSATEMAQFDQLHTSLKPGELIAASAGTAFTSPAGGASAMSFPAAQAPATRSA